MFSLYLNIQNLEIRHIFSSNFLQAQVKIPIILSASSLINQITKIWPSFPDMTSRMRDFCLQSELKLCTVQKMLYALSNSYFQKDGQCACCSRRIMCKPHCKKLKKSHGFHLNLLGKLMKYGIYHQRQRLPRS